MGMVKHEVNPLFIEPIFKVIIGDAIGPKEVEFIKSLKMIQNQSNLISENLSIFDEPELKGLKKAVHGALDIYAQEIMGTSNKLYVTQSWSLINPPGVGMHGHTHSNSLISGSIYYTDMPEPPAKMVFDRESDYQRIQVFPERGKVNLYNTTKNIVIPQKGEMYLFNSGLLHMVEENLSNQPRYSIAFNTFMKGQLGDYRDVSVLEL